MTSIFRRLVAPALVFALFFAVLTNESPYIFIQNGLTMILVPRGPGVETRPIKTTYSPAAGTAFITFDNVKVPVENTLGEVNKGLKVILSNFNHERWVMVCYAVQGQRNIVDETLRSVESCQYPFTSDTEHFPSFGHS